MNRWPQYLIERARQKPPQDCCVIPASTPVVSFGDPVSPKVATLGINPSSSEFLDDDSLLAGNSRRLATLTSLGVSSWAELGDTEAAAIVDDCAAYFDEGHKPYKRWFNPLDRILGNALGVSYFDRSASHLDLVQWATQPVWKDLDKEVQDRLLSADLPFLEHQLNAQNYRVVIVNGATAMRSVERVGLVDWTEVRALSGPPRARVSVGDKATTRFIGWSCNLQSQPGAPRLAPQLTDIAREYGQAVLSTAVAAPEGGPHE